MPQPFESDQSTKHGLFRPENACFLLSIPPIRRASTGQYSDRLWAAYPANPAAMCVEGQEWFSAVSRPTLSTTQPPVEWVQLPLSRRLRTSGSVPPLSRKSSWRDSALIVGYLSTDIFGRSWIRILSCRSKFINFCQLQLTFLIF
jgi:hypothetical protein